MKRGVMVSNASPNGFNGNLTAFQPQMRGLVNDLVNKGWTGRLSSKGHAIMLSPDGESTIAISRMLKSQRQYHNIVAEIRRIERKEVSGDIWTGVGEGGRVLTNGESFKCSVCNKLFTEVRQAAGHYNGMHGPGIANLSAHRAKASATRKRNNEIRKRNAEAEAEAAAAALPTANPDVLVEATTETTTPEVVVEVTPPTSSANAFINWLTSMPVEALEELTNMQVEIESLRADNKRLRDGLKALTELAGEL